ncbi:MAG: orotidine-5'-phosphate decarboxylase [Myxococcota bacterium]
MSFFGLLEERARKTSSLLCVGLDPATENVDGIRDACFRIIDATAEHACAFKPNSAFFEAHGAKGWAALKEVIAHVPQGIPVILDVKRGDIGDTNDAYARACFDELGAHAITASPYLGGEALSPLLKRSDRGVFLLCRTSNPGAEELQGLTVGGQALFEVVAGKAQQWNRNGNVGLVAGATDPDALARVRAAAPDLWLLVPGVGAQGGDLEASVRAGLRGDGLGMLINVSRGISRAQDPGAEARKLKESIRAAAEKRGVTTRAKHPGLAQALAQAGCVRFGKFTLKSGKSSPIYMDLRQLVSFPVVLRRAAQAYAGILATLKFDRVAGIPYAALPIATAIGLETGLPVIYPRREVKEYGTKAAIEGVFKPGETAVMIDDLATTGDTKIEAIKKLEEQDLVVKDIVVLIERGQGATEMLAKAGYRMHAVITLREILEDLRQTNAITVEQYREVMDFLAAG